MPISALFARRPEFGLQRTEILRMTQRFVGPVHAVHFTFAGVEEPHTIQGLDQGASWITEFGLFAISAVGSSSAQALLSKEGELPVNKGLMSSTRICVRIGAIRLDLLSRQWEAHLKHTPLVLRDSRVRLNQPVAFHISATL